MRMISIAFTLGLLLAPALRADEASLLQQLATGSAEARDAARQTLLATATPAAIPSLASQLERPETFDNACFLLEAMQLPEADAALVAALDRTGGREKAGLLDALTRRRSPLAETKAFILCGESTDPVQSAAIRYVYAVMCVNRPQCFHDKGAAELRAADAALSGLERLAEVDRAQAARSYESLFNETNCPDHVRLAAYCGLLRTDSQNVAARLKEGLSHASPVWRGTAARLAAQMPDKALNKLGGRFLAQLPAEGRLALINALVAEKSRAGAPLVRAALADADDSATRLAAAAGLGDVGDADDADGLIALLASDDSALAEAARVSLIKLVDAKADARLVRALGKRASGEEPAVRLLSIVASRRSPKAAPKLVPYLSDISPRVRAAALAALGELGGPDQVPAVFAAACKASDSAEVKAAEKAVASLARRHASAVPGAAASLLPAAGTEPRRCLLRALGISGAPEGLPLVLASLKDAEADVADDALRVLADWRDPAASGALLEQAKSNAKNSLRVLALRGYIRLIAKQPSLDARAAQCRAAAALASRPEEKLLLAEAWSSVPTPEAVGELKAYLDDGALKSDALRALRVLALKTPVDLPDVAPASLLTPLNFLPRRLNNHRSEACAAADFNGDGKIDIAAGPFLYLAPDWKAVQIREVSTTVTDDGKGYADDFCNLVLDVNKDGKPDIVSGGWFNRTSFWFENTCGKPGLWPAHVIDPLGNHETGTLEDIDGDGKALEFLPQSHATVWYEIGKDTNGAPNLVRHTVSEKRNKLGAGCGDISGDGRPDILRPDVWFEAPKNIRSGAWVEHPAAWGGTNGTSDHTSNMLVFDVNQDGLNDVIASIAHKHGIWWYEQRRAADGAIAWSQHTIDDTWTQPHYLAFADIDKDGNNELISGKRFMAHNGNDPDEFGKLCLFYYRFTPGPSPAFRKHVISYDEGVSAGLNIVPVDIDADGDLDLVTTGKWGGPVLYENKMTQPVTAEERRAALQAAAPASPSAAAAAGENLALASRGSKAISDSEFAQAPGCTPRLNDGDRGGHPLAQKRWHAALTPGPHWAEIRLAKPAKVGRAVAYFADPAGYATAYEVQVRQGQAYRTVFSTADNRSAAPANVTFAPVETDAVRFVFLACANPAYPQAAQLCELEVYAQ